MRNKKTLVLGKAAAMSAAAVMILSLTGCGAISLDAGETGNDQSANQTAASEENTRNIQVRVTSIIGNEITYVVTDDGSEEETKSETATETATETAMEADSEAAQEPGQGDIENGGGFTPPGGQDGSQEKPDFPAMENGSSTGSETTERGFGKRGFDSSESGEGFTPPTGRDGSIETVTAYIPVGATVYTDTGKTTTFSIIQAGDSLALTIVTDEEGNETITEARIVAEE